MESVLIKDSLDCNRYIIEIENNNVIYIFCKDLKLHFKNKLWCYDYHRYIYVNQKVLNEIGFTLIENKNDWDIINNCCDKLRNLRNKQYNEILDKNGIVKEKYHKYSVIAYRCCDFIHRKYKTIDYINQLIGVYANQL